MRSSILSMFFILGLIVSPSFAQTSFRYAVDYNDFIIAEQTKIGTVINDFMKACGKGRIKDMENKHVLVIKQIDASLLAIKGLKPYKNNVAFRDAGIRLFDTYKSIAQSEYLDIIALMNEGIEVGDNRARFNNVIFKIDERIKPSSDKFLVEQINFAEAFKVNLGANQLESEADPNKP